jgi:hypothetical protein
MRHTRSRLDRSAARRPGVWLLLFALALQGYAGAVVQLLGPMHHHDRGGTSAVALSDRLHLWLDALQAWHDEPHVRGGVPGLPKHDGSTHRHTLFERHHHDRHDASVVAVDAGAIDEAMTEAATASGSFAAAPGLAVGLLLRTATSRASWGLPVQARAWQDAAARRPERPPPA